MKAPSYSIHFKSTLAFAAAAALAITATTQAQSILGSAQLANVGSSDGYFNYTITLDNSSASTSPVGTFWYAWTPGYFFLNSTPVNIMPPDGWTGVEQDDGYYSSILFTANSTASNLQPGASLAFSFSSFDSPATLNGDSWDYYDEVGTSYLYSGNVSGTASEFIVGPAPAPEPSTLALMALGGAGCLYGRWRKLWSK